MTIKQFRIYEEDLASLERLVPELAEAASSNLTNKLRVQIRSVQKILSGVRWSYGPPTHVENIPATDDQA